MFVNETKWRSNVVLLNLHLFIEDNNCFIKKPDNGQESIGCFPVYPVYDNPPIRGAEGTLTCQK